jgi:hypothetical protein
MRSDLRRAAAAGAAALLTGAMCLAPNLAEAQRFTGFGFCAPPYPPRCVSDPATYGSPTASEQCQDDVNRYVNSVATYRMCLTQETERAVREVNGTLSRWKCGLAAKAICQ